MPELRTIFMALALVAFLPATEAQRSGDGPGLDVPVKIPGSSSRQPEDRAEGRTPGIGQLPDLERNRIAVIVSRGSSMGSLVRSSNPAEPSTRMKLAIQEISPFIRFLGDDVELAIVEVAEVATSVLPSLRPRTHAPDASAHESEDSQAANDSASNDSAPDDSAPNDSESGASTSDTSVAPDAPDSPDARQRQRADDLSQMHREDLAPAIMIENFHSCSPALKQAALDGLENLTPGRLPASGLAMVQAIKALTQVQGLRQIFLLADTLGAYGDKTTSPAEGSVELTSHEVARQVVLLLSVIDERERPRINVLSLAVAGSEADRALESLARETGGIFLRRPNP